ncbi:MAG TPA: histidine phosphotransferase family protein [Kaistiaceae bacterium]|nr:histidine phosphotransferase family protein [Kaistiaceae bacterium]
MTDTSEIAALELAALLCSRVCHDLVSPVGAIANGLELLDENPGEDMRGFAMDLIAKSARQASAKLQFARIAFGAAGSAGASIDLGDAEAVAKGYFAGEKPDLEWTLERAYMAKNKVKLLLNLLLIAATGVPRGGIIAVSMAGGAETPAFTIRATGPSARLPAVTPLVLGAEEGHAADAHSIQPIYTRLLAENAGMKLSIEMDGEAVLIKSEPLPAMV